MQGATRLGDQCTGHDSCGPRPLITGSGSVFFNGRSAGRVGDQYAVHSCDTHSPHNDEISAGSGSVFIEGMPVARIGDAVSIGGTVMEGSGDIFIGG